MPPIPLFGPLLAVALVFPPAPPLRHAHSSHGRWRTVPAAMCDGSGKPAITNILAELDEAVAATAADRAEKLKTTQEKLAAEQAALKKDAGMLPAGM